MNIYTINITTPTQLKQALKALDYTRDKKAKDVVSWSLDKATNKLSITLIIDEGTAITHSIDTEQVEQSLKFVTSLSPLSSFDCKKDDYVQLIIKDNVLYLINASNKQTLQSALLETSKYYYEIKPVKTEYYFSLSKLKRLLHRLTTKSEGIGVGVSIENGALCLCTGSVHIKMMRVK